MRPISVKEKGNKEIPLVEDRLRITYDVLHPLAFCFPSQEKHKLSYLHSNFSFHFIDSLGEINANFSF